MSKIPICTISNLSLKLQKGVYILKDISYTINKNDFVVILGSNGSGKTTMLKAISGVIKKYSGHIKLFDKLEIRKSSNVSKYIGTMTQNTADSLFMEFSLRQNLQMYLDAFFSEHKTEESFLDLIKTINPKLIELLCKKTSSLSGGERQSFLLALNLFFKRDLLLLDEHTSALDPKTAREVMRVTAEKLRDNNITCIMTTHSLDDALKYGNRLIAMQNGQIIKTFDEQEKYSLSKADLLDYCY
jgi:putative ABC transport system ATP-binding protein